MQTSTCPRTLGLFALAIVAGCPFHPIAGEGKPAGGKPPECRADIPADTYAECKCGDSTANAGPGGFCSPPKIVFERVCMVDSSCNAYDFDGEKDALDPDTDRDDVAFRWEFATPLPPGANLALNMPPADDESRTQSPLSLYGVKDPTEDDIAVNPGPDTWLDAEVLVSADRKSLTIVPRRRCLEGRWLVRSELTLDLLLDREDICGEPDFVRHGFSAVFALE